MQQVIIKRSDEPYVGLEIAFADALKPCYTPERWCIEAVESALPTRRVPRVAHEIGGHTEERQ